MIGLLGNEVQVMFVTFSSSITFIKAGKIGARSSVFQTSGRDAERADHA